MDLTDPENVKDAGAYFPYGKSEMDDSLRRFVASKGRVVFPGIVEQVIVAGQKAYILAGYLGLQIFDIKNPAEPL